eukprot:scaffold7404_cov363-Prasinococcus_capsulatus_cf.AAC.2
MVPFKYQDDSNLIARNTPSPPACGAACPRGSKVVRQSIAAGLLPRACPPGKASLKASESETPEASDRRPELRAPSAVALPGSPPTNNRAARSEKVSVRTATRKPSVPNPRLLPLRRLPCDQGVRGFWPPQSTCRLGNCHRCSPL